MALEANVVEVPRLTGLGNLLIDPLDRGSADLKASTYTEQHKRRKRRGLASIPHVESETGRPAA
jgi:hypothetical protein